MKYLKIWSIFFTLSILLNGNTEPESDFTSQPDTRFEIAFMPDIHFHDVFAEFDDNRFEGLTTEYLGENRKAAIRTMQAQLTSTRLFNENYFAFLAALDDAVKRGIKIIALPGDFSDDGQPVHVKGLVEILDQYKEEYDLQFFITPGNHDPTRPFASEAGKSDYLGVGGRPQPIFSLNHPRCKKIYNNTIESGNPQPHQVVCTDKVKEMGYQGLFEQMGDFGLNPKQEHVYYETPFSSYHRSYDSFNHKKKEFGFDKRQYEICREGSGGDYRKPDYTHCTNVMDMSYLVEPVEGLWLLAIDANVYIPSENRSGTRTAFSGSGNSGYNKIATHKKHLLTWMESVASRAEEKGKTLIAFSHFPAADFYNGAKPKIEELWGENEFQLARVPSDSASSLFAKTGINIHMAGHMHMNGTEVFRDSTSGNIFTNIQVPSLAAYVPAYKIIRTESGSDQVEVETVSLEDVPGFDTLFPHYQQEWDYLKSIEYEWIWDRNILNSTTYSEFTNWHIKELSRLRFLPREWPNEVRSLLSGMTGKDMLIATQLQNSTLFTNYKQWLDNRDEDIENMTTDFSQDWEEAQKKADLIAQEAGFNLSDFEKWNGVDLSIDFYRIRNAGELAMPDITKNRIKQYLFIANTLFESTIKKTDNRNNQQKFHETFKDKFRTVFEVMSIFENRLPNINFQVNLETGEIKNLSIDK